MASFDSQDRYRKQFHKTSMCRYFFEGSCRKGGNCSHAHSEQELNEKPVLSRTRMCKSILRTGKCESADCSFAHDVSDLIEANAFFRTKMCDFYANGHCKLAEQCRYAHSMEQLTSEVPEKQQESGVVAAPSGAAPQPKFVPQVDFNDSPDTGYPLKKKSVGTLSSASVTTYASSSYGGSYSSMTNLLNSDTQNSAIPTAMSAPYVFVYPCPATVMPLAFVTPMHAGHPISQYTSGPYSD